MKPLGLPEIGEIIQGVDKKGKGTEIGRCRRRKYFPCHSQ